MPTTPALNGYFGQVRRNEKNGHFLHYRKTFCYGNNDKHYASK